MEEPDEAVVELAQGDGLLVRRVPARSATSFAPELDGLGPQQGDEETAGIEVEGHLQPQLHPRHGLEALVAMVEHGNGFGFDGKRSGWHRNVLTGLLFRFSDEEATSLFNAARARMT